MGKNTNRVKKRIIFIFFLASFGFLFFRVSAVQASTLYFNGGADIDWNTRIGNWWTDAGFTLQAPSLPTVNDDVIISQRVWLNSGLPGSPASVNTMTVNGSADIQISVTVANGATFNDTSYNNTGIITGDATFNDTSYNHAGTITGDAAFNGLSFNNGTVTGTATYSNATGGVITISDGGQWGSGTAGSNVGITGGPIISWIFNGSGANSGTTGDATFNGSSNNIGTVAGNATFNGSNLNFGTTGDATFNGSSINIGTINGNVIFNHSSQNASSTTGDATFNNTSSNTGTITGDATFNGSSSNTGTITGDATFNGLSTNYGTVTGTATYSNATGGVITIPDGGTWGSGTAGSNVGITGGPIISWIFNGSSYNNSGATTGDATFNDTSSNGGTVTGDPIFNDSSSNSFSVIGNPTFNDSSVNYNHIDGNAIFNSLSMNSFGGTVTGDACFAPTATNLGTVGGDITVCPPLSVVIPTLATSSASSVIQTTATLNGNMTNNGGANATERGFNYGLTNSYGANITQSSGLYGTGAFSADVLGLVCNTTYHFRSYAINSAGTVLGNDTSFITSPCATTPPAPSGGGGGGGFFPTPPPTPPATSTPPAIPPGLLFPYINIVNVRLVNDNGTYFFIANGIKQGITDPGILNSYGFSFKDAAIATLQDKASTLGSNLPPANGSLVRSEQDPTIYLFSQGQRFAFTSGKVFTALGFKFASVLIISNSELQVLPKAAQQLNDGKTQHLPGQDINLNKTIYFIGDDLTLHGYPSMSIYNSWNIDNDFSRVVPANAADNQLPIGELVVERTIN